MLFVPKTTYLIMRQHLPRLGRHSPTCFARTRQTCQHLQEAIFEKNVTRLDTFARVMSESCKFGASGHCLTKTQLIFIQPFCSLNACSASCSP